MQVNLSSAPDNPVRLIYESLSVTGSSITATASRSPLVLKIQWRTNRRLLPLEVESFSLSIKTNKPGNVHR